MPRVRVIKRAELVELLKPDYRRLLHGYDYSGDLPDHSHRRRQLLNLAD